MAAADAEIEVEGHRLRLSNLDKVLYPATGFTKGQVIDYYARIGPVMLPHLHGRPLTLKRYPNGVDSQFFYEKQCPSHAPDWVQVCEVPSRGTVGGIIRYCVADDLATLVWLANLAALELHPLLATRDNVERPTVVAFDLDPGPPAGIAECVDVALSLRELLDALGLVAFPKTSGSKGLQVYMPLNSDVTYEETKPFAHAVARLLERRHADLVVENMDKSLRRGRVLVDWSQNHITKTTVAAYSLRAMACPTVSTPLTWDEVEHASASRDAESLVFEAGAVLDRVTQSGDLFAPVNQITQSLPEVARVPS